MTITNDNATAIRSLVASILFDDNCKFDYDEIAEILGEPADLLVELGHQLALRKLSEPQRARALRYFERAACAILMFNFVEAPEAP
jgi:hypothetical protein